MSRQSLKNIMVTMWCFMKMNGFNSLAKFQFSLLGAKKLHFITKALILAPKVCNMFFIKVSVGWQVFYESTRSKNSSLLHRFWFYICRWLRVVHIRNRKTHHIIYNGVYSHSHRNHIIWYQTNFFFCITFSFFTKEN